MNNLKQQATRAFIWDFSGRLAMHGTGFIVSIFLARLLEPSDFGLIAMVMVIIGIAGIFTDVGLGAALIQRKRVLPIHYSSVFFFNIAVGSLLTLLTFISAPLIASFYNNQALIPLTQAISFAFILGAFSSVQSTKLRKDLNYALLAKVSFLASFISGFLGVVLAYFGAGVWSLVMQALSQRLVYNIIIWTMSLWKPSLSFSFKALMQLWVFGFRIFLSALLDIIFTRIDTLIIGKLFTPVTLGYFNLAKQMDQMVIHYSSGSLMSVLFPVLSKVKNDLPRFQKIIQKTQGILIFVVFFLLGILYLVSHELIIMLFGGKWLQTVEYFKILLLSGFGYPISALLVNILSSRGNSKAFLRLEIYKKIVFGTNLVIGFMWGIEGYLYGLVFAMLVAVLLNIIFVSRELTLPKMLFIKPIFTQMLLTIIVTLIVQFLNEDLKFSNFVIFLIKGCEFSILYLILNKVLSIKSYKYFISEVTPIYNRMSKKTR